jgi:hypothetical protein
MNDISSSLLSLLATCGITHTNTLKSIVHATQKAWLLPRDRVLPEGTTYPLTKAKLIYKHLEALNFINEQQARANYYDYIIVPGGETATLQTRITYLIQCLKSITSKKILFHCGTQLLPDYDLSWQLPIDVPTELATSRYLYQHMLLPIIKTIPVEFIAIPVGKNKTRPNTADGVIAWLSTAPPPGSCLITSNQPYIHYQDAVFKTYLPSSYSVETVGPSLDNTPLSEILDYTARYFYQEYQRQHKGYRPKAT